MKQMDVLDGIRGYAIVTVMLYHFTQHFQHLPLTDLTGFEWTIARLFEGMWLGVDLFFVMSGFLITSILLGTVGQPDYFKNFYVRRVLRIFPLYYAVLLGLMVIVPMISAGMAEQTQAIRDNAPYFLTYTINWRIAYLGDFREISAGYMWSLAVEEQFYLIWPLIVVWCRRYLATLCFSLAGISLLAKLVLHGSGVEGPSLYAATLTHMDGLLLGAGLAAIYRTHDQRVPRHISSLIKAFGGASFLVMFLLVMKNGHLRFYEDLNPVIGITAFSLMFLALLVAVLERPAHSNLNQLFTWKPIMFCGKLCYGLYLLHHPIGVLVEKTVSGRLPGVSPLFEALLISGVSLAASIIVAYASFHLFEKHFLSLKRYFETATPSEQAPASAQTGKKAA